MTIFPDLPYLNYDVMKVNGKSLTWNRENCLPVSVDNEVEGSLILYFLASCLGNWVYSEEEGCLILYFIFVSFPCGKLFGRLFSFGILNLSN